MIVELMLRALIIGATVTAATIILDSIFRELGKPRRGIWSGAILLSVVLPLASVAVESLVATTSLPTWTGSAQILSAARAVSRAPDAVALRAGGVNAWLGALWIGGSMLLFACLLWTHRQLVRNARGDARVIDGVDVIISANVGPAVGGLRSQRIVLPRWVLDAPASDRALMIRHELEHVQARDGWLLAGSVLALVLMPWNVALWFQQRALRRTVETDCDTRVLASSEDLREYGLMLLRVSARANALPMAVPFLVGTRRLLEQRILAMTHDPVGRRGAMLPQSLAALFLVFSATLAAVPLGVDAGDRGGWVWVSTERAIDSAKVERIVLTPEEAREGKGSRRASLVLIDGKVSSYDALRNRSIKRMRITLPPESMRLYGPRASQGVLIATTK